MDVNSVMSTYNMNSLWNSLNSQNSSTSSNVPLLSNVNSSVNEDNAQMNFLGQTIDSQLQDIYEKVEPNYGISFTYDKNGNFTMPTDINLPTDSLSLVDSNIVSLLNSGNSTADNITQNILYQYNSLENGMYNSILSNNRYNIYNTIYSLGNYQVGSSSNFINTTV